MNKQYDPNIHHRRSIRLAGYDYSQYGEYFVTVCVHGKKCLFGDVLDGDVQLNETGIMVKHVWEWLPQQYPYVSINEYVVMPNHFHGILTITDDCVGAVREPPKEICTFNAVREPPTNCEPPLETVHAVKRKPIGRLIGVFKTVTTKRFNEMGGLHNKIGGSRFLGGVHNEMGGSRTAPTVDKLWQRNYYEHIIRNDDDYLRIAEYIQSNPINWKNDQLWTI
jgi:REP element-mobilizing transposase RayT